MKRKIIIGLLIGQYERAIAAIKALGADKAGLKRYKLINRYSVESGVCLCANREFGQDITNRYWILRHCQYGGYWKTQSRFGGTKEHMLELLQFRLDLLRKIHKESDLVCAVKDFIYWFKKSF